MKKIFISADIEGCCGVNHWDETEIGKPGYDGAREQMTAEVVAACEGAYRAGVTDIVVRDAHDSARNIIADRLPKDVRLIRGWAGHPYCMMYGLDATYDAALMIGYHAGAGNSGSPLAHTMTTTGVASVCINGLFASEFYINAMIASREGVPTVFVSGDRGICDEAEGLIAGIGVVPVKEGMGGATINEHPAKACALIADEVYAALNQKIAPCAMPELFEVVVHYLNPALAYRYSFYPGAKLAERNKVTFTSHDYFAVLSFMRFCL